MRRTIFPAALLAILCALIPAPASAATITRPPNDLGLVDYWTMDGKDMNWSTGILTDQAGSYPMNAVTLSTTTTPVLGKIGQAFSYKQDGYLNTSTAYHALDGSTGLTVCGWVYLNTLGSADTDDSAIFAVNNTSTGAMILWYNTNISGSDHAHVYTFDVGDTSDPPGRVNGSTAAKTQTWQFVCGVMSGSSRFIYLNGALDGSSTGAVTTTYSNVNTASIANWSNGTNYLVNGRVDDVRIYKRALSAAEIAQLYGRGQSHAGASSATLTGGSSLSSGLVALWTMDGKDTNWNTGQEADESGNGNAGTLVNLSTTTSPGSGMLGQALSFNGSSSYIAGGDMFWNDSMTVCAWLNPSSVTGGARSIVVKRNSSGGTSGTPEWVLDLNGTGNLDFNSFNTGGTNALKITAPSTVTANTWYYVCAVQNGAGNTGYLYVNGTQVANGTQNGTMIDSTSKVQVGVRSNNDDTRWFGGAVDDVRIYNRPLSASEVTQLYKLGAATANASGAALTGGSSLASGLIGYWTMDGKDTNWATGQETDKSGNGNTGSFVSMSTTTSPVVGKSGQAVNFKGNGGRISSSLVPGSQGTVVAWIRPNATLGASSPDMVIVDAAGLGGRDTLFRLNWAKAAPPSNCRNGTSLPNGSIDFVISPSSPHYSVACTTTTSWAANTWYMLVATWDGTRQQLYVNGALEDDVSQAFTGGWGAIEAGSQAGSVPFDGSVDDVRIYNRVLSATEISQLYNIGK